MFKGMTANLAAQIPALDPGRQWGEGPATLNTVAWGKQGYPEESDPQGGAEMGELKAQEACLGVGVSLNPCPGWHFRFMLLGSLGFPGPSCISLAPVLSPHLLRSGPIWPHPPEHTHMST